MKDDTRKTRGETGGEPPAWRARAMAAFLAAAFAVLVMYAARHGGRVAGPSNGASRPLIEVGSPAPDFTLFDAHGDPMTTETRVTLSQVADQHIVLLVYFPGYTCADSVSHLRALANHKELGGQSVQVLAVSAGTVAETRDSIELYGDLPFPMLSDADERLAQAFNLVEEGGAVRHGVFIINRWRKVMFVERTSDPPTNIDEIVSRLRDARGGR